MKFSITGPENMSF